MNIEIRFLNQKNRHSEDSDLKFACGAFCIKYWHWHSGREDYTTVNQEEAILEVYNRIKFGSIGEKFGIKPHWGNPFMICRESGGTFFFNKQDKFISPLVDVMYEKVKDVQIVEKELTLDIGQYAILLLRSEQNPQHYTLLHRKNDGYYIHTQVRLNHYF